MLKIKLVIIYSFFALTNIIFANVLSEFELIKLDSLVFQNNSADVAHFFNQKDDDILSLGCFSEFECSNYEMTKKQYLNIFRHYEVLDTISEPKLDQYLAYYKTLEHQYTTENGGQVANIYYDRYQNCINSNEKKKSYISYNLAFIRRTVYKINMNKYYDDKIEEIKNYIATKNFQQASILVNNLLLESDKKSPNNMTIKKLKDLENTINKNLEIISIENKLDHQTQILNKKNSIGIGFHTYLFISNLKNNDTWKYQYGIEKTVFSFDISNIKYKSGMGYIFEYNRFISPKINTAFNFSYDKLSLKFTNATTNFDSDFNCKKYSLSNEWNYYFKNTLGLRPYIGTGYQYSLVKKDKFIYQEGLTPYTRTYILKDQDSINQVLFNLGMDFIGSESRNLMYKIKLQFISNIDPSILIGSISSLASVNIFYLF